MRFLEPWYLLLLVPVAAGLALTWKSVHGMAAGRKRVAFVLRALLAACLVLALAVPQWHVPNRGTCTMFVVDWSDSVSQVDKQRALDFLDGAMGKLGADDVAGIVVFGAQPSVESAPGGRRSVRRIESKVDGSASNLASALRVASASFPEGKSRRIVVLSDGNETAGDAVEAAEVASGDEITIDTVSLGSEMRSAEASVLELQAPSERTAEETFDLRAVLESSIDQSGTLVIDRDGVVVARVPVRLPKGKSTVVLTQRLSESGFYRFRATLQVGQDRDNRNNLGAAFVAVRGLPKVLLIQGDTSKKELASALQKQGISVTLQGAAGMPTRPEDVQPYDAVILNDFNAALTTEHQMSVLRAAVRDAGVGLMMVGGEDSFLPGGWYGSPVADALPVDLNVRQRKVFPSTTVLIVVDTSGSMSMIEDGVTKLQLAAKAAVMTARLLSPNDKLGVAGSSDRIDFVAPVQKLTDVEKVVAQIRRLAPGGGGIYAEPSVAFASRTLEADDSRVRHFILLADGADCDQHGISLGLAAAMRNHKITTSCVAIGAGKDVNFLKSLAAAGGGRFYLADKASKLPQIFTQDVSTMSRSAIEEGAFLPKLAAGEEALRGIDSTPPLLAYCLAEAKPLAKVGMKTHKDDPLLASWQYGLAKTVAFTSDAQNRWAHNWVGWGDFPKFWAQVVRTMNRQVARNNYDLSVEPQGGKGLITVQATDQAGNPLNDPELRVKVSTPEGKSEDVVLSADAPGSYSGMFTSGELGSYIVSVVEKGPGGENRIGSSGFSIPYPPEYRQQRTNTAVLGGLRQLTGGKELRDASEALKTPAQKGSSVGDMWPWLLLAAALLLPLDVAVRRLAIPWPQIAGFLRRRRHDEVETVGRLEGTGIAERPSVQPAAQVEPPREKVKRRHSPAPTTGSAAAKLLEAKRKKQEDKDSSGDGTP